MTKSLSLGIAAACAVALFACGGETPVAPDAGETPTDAGNNSGDVTPPTVIATSPASSAINVDVGTPIAIEFSEAMDPASVQVSTNPSIALGAPSWAFGDTVATFTPTTPLSWETAYNFSVTAKDRAGNALTPLDFAFFTGAQPNLTPPSITGSTPANGATQVPTSTHLSITFSRAMDPGTVIVTSTPDYALGEATWDPEHLTVIFDAPSAELTAATAYTFTVAGEDTGGRALTGTTTIGFTTAAPPDITPPTVVNQAPAAGATGVPINTTISLTFSEPMNEASVESAFSVAPSLGCIFLWDSTSKLMTCSTLADAAYSTTYTVTLGTGAKDANGNALAAPHTFTFTTAAAPDTTKPTVVSVSPSNASIGASRGTYITVEFSEPMDKASAQAAFAITQPVGYSGGVFNWNAAGTMMTYDPPTSFLYGTTVYWQLSTTAQDLAGNGLAATVSRSFRVIRSSSVVLYSAASLDGQVSDTSQVSTTNGTLPVGDIGFSSINVGLRSFLTFDLTPLPTTLTSITGVTLYVTQSSTAGSPYGTGTGNLGYLIAESVNYGLSLTASAYSTPSLGTSYTVATTAFTGTRAVTVTTKVQDDWVNRASRGNRSQFRLRFSLRDKTTDGSSDNVAIFAAEDASSVNRPRLSVTYEYP